MSEINQNLELTLTILPILILILIVEYLVGLYKGRRVYGIKDTLSNMGIGLLISVPGTVSKGLFFLVYTFLNQYAFFQLDNVWWVFILCFLASDLTYYLFHRLGHETQFFWAGHVTHHSSTAFNLTIGFRVSVQAVYRFIFWTPLALIGFPPVMIVLTDTMVTLYMFFLHTKVIGKLGILESLLNTPSHHRVHHASNAQYLDMNYGGVLIIWDRLFKTFMPEKEQPVYGITEEVNTHHPVHLIFDEYVNTYKQVKSKSFSEAMRYLFAKPVANNASASDAHDCTNCKIVCPFKSPMEHFLDQRLSRVKGVQIQLT